MTLSVPVAYSFISNVYVVCSKSKVDLSKTAVISDSQNISIPFSYFAVLKTRPKVKTTSRVKVKLEILILKRLNNLLKFSYSSPKDIFIEFSEIEREGGNVYVREKHPSVASYVCPDQGSNPQPFDV